MATTDGRDRQMREIAQLRVYVEEQLERAVDKVEAGFAEWAWWLPLLEERVRQGDRSGPVIRRLFDLRPWASYDPAWDGPVAREIIAHVARIDRLAVERGYFGDPTDPRADGAAG